MADLAAWLKDPAAVRLVLVEVGVQVLGVEQTRYLSTKPYVTSPTDSPPNQFYNPIVTTGFKFTEEISIDGEGSFSAGDIEILNIDGERDDWLNDIWDNHELKAWIGDPRWPRSEFQLIFNGVVASIGSKSRDVLNLTLRDKLQRLNTPITDAKIGGSGANKDEVISLTFGEVHNVTPQLTNPVTLEYQVHDSNVEAINEVRDNGKPVSASIDVTTGRFTLTRQSAGGITATVQGDKLGGTWRKTVASLVQRIVTGYGQADSRFSATENLPAGRYAHSYMPLFASFIRTSTASYVDASGYVRTAAAGEPRLDHSKGYPELLLEGAATNLCTYSAQIENAVFGKSLLTLKTTNGPSPDSLSFAEMYAPNTTSGAHYIDRTVTGTYVNGQQYTMVVHVKAAGITKVRLDMYYAVGGASGKNTSFDLTTGLRTAGTADAYSITPLANGWYRLAMTQTVDTAATESTRLLARLVYLDSAGSSTFVGDNTAGVWIWGWMVNAGLETSYVPTSTATATRTAETASLYSEIDTANMAAFEATHQQPVGAYADGRTNVLNLCQELASSVGAQLVMSRAGKLRLLKLKLPADGTPVEVYPQDMVERSLRIKERPFVKAAVKLGFAKNWTVQEGLLTNIPEEHKKLYEMEWLTATASNSTTQAAYKLNSAPTQEDTMLLRRQDADTEAQRRVDLWSVPRTVFEFEATTQSALLATIELGSAIKLYNRRFGLQEGKTGMVVSLAPDWLTGKVTVGVLI